MNLKGLKSVSYKRQSHISDDANDEIVYFVNLDVDDETADDLYDTRGGKSKYSAVAYYLEDMSMTENYMPITAHMPQDRSVKKVFTTDKIELYYDGEYGNYFAIVRDSFKSWYEQLNLVDNSELYQI